MHVIADHANFQEIAFEIGYLLGQENRPESLTLTEEMNPSMPIHHDNHDEDDSNKTTVFRSPLLEKKAPPKKASELLSGFFLKRSRGPELSVAERVLLNSDSYEILLEVFKNSSIDKYSVEIIKELLKSTDLLSHIPNALQAFVLAMKSQKLSYGYCHSFMSYLILLPLSEQFSWRQEQSKNKLLYLSLFRDLGLHNDRLIKAHHNPTERAKLNEDDSFIVHNHADVAATILEGIIKSSKDVPSMIREHHGMRNGKGFADTLSLGVGPLTMANIVIEDLVTLYMENLERTEPDKEVFLKIAEELQQKYVKLTYADVAMELVTFF